MTARRRKDELDLSVLSGLTGPANAILRAEEQRLVDRRDRPPPPVDWTAVRSLRGPSIVVRVLLLAWVVFAGVAIAASAAQRSLLQRVGADPASLRWSEIVADTDRVDLVNHVAIGLLVASAVSWLVWFFLAYANLGPLALPHRWGWGWAVGAWFVPVLCWWRPKQLADDVWASVDRLRRNEGRVPSRGVLTAWWVAWIATFVAAFIANGDHGAVERAANSGSVDRFVDEALKANALSTVRAALFAASAVLAFLVVRAITRAQARPAT